MKNNKKASNAARIIFAVLFLIVGFSLAAAAVSAANHIHQVPAPVVVLAVVFFGLGILLLATKKAAPGKEFWQAKDDRAAAKAAARVGRISRVETLQEIGRKAPRDDVAAAAFARLRALGEHRRVEEFAASRYNNEPRRAVALDYVEDMDIVLGAAKDGPEQLAAKAIRMLTDEAGLLKVALERKDALAGTALAALRDQNAVAQVAAKRGDETGEKAVAAITDDGLLATLAADGSAPASCRALAYDRLGRPDEADLLRVPPYGCDAKTRRAAAARILDSGNTMLVEKAVMKVLGAQQDSVGKDFLADAAQKYPDVIRRVWPRMRDWSRNSTTTHTDVTRNAPHVDSTQYYDFFRYPDGRTVANRNGRKKHTDGPLPSSDCADYGHTDSTSHQDTEDTAFLAKFPPAVSDGEEIE